jgi:hypothetical protein
MAAGNKREVCRKLTRCILARRADGQGRHDSDHTTTINALTRLRDTFCKSNYNTSNYFFYTDNHSIKLAQADDEDLYKLASTEQCLSTHSANISDRVRMSRESENSNMMVREINRINEQQDNEERDNAKRQDAENEYFNNPVNEFINNPIRRRFRSRSQSPRKSLKNVGKKNKSKEQTKVRNKQKEDRQNTQTDKRTKPKEDDKEDGEVSGGKIRKTRKTRKTRKIRKTRRLQ